MMPGQPQQAGSYGRSGRALARRDAGKVLTDDGEAHARNGNDSNEQAMQGYNINGLYYQQYGGTYDENVQEVGIRPGQTVRLIAGPDEDEPEFSMEGHPQERIAKFWANFEPDYPGGVIQILPEPLAKAGLSTIQPDSTIRAVTSYSQARDQCNKSVKKIIRECTLLNQKYTDPHFDIEYDLKVARWRHCLDSLVNTEELRYNPEDVKRVTEIFKDPQFYKDGASFDDIVQGLIGDCWLLAALSTLTSNEQLLRNVCVIQDQEVGVYGFVFYRDGEWQPCIIDDKLYLRAPSYEESDDTILTTYYVKQKDEEKRYKNVFQTGSKALYFAGCRDQNETWVPLLEKAFAKAHGDYAAISGGQTGEALEDLTGGVTTEIYTTNIISKDKFWNDNLSKAGSEFLFSCAMASYTNWRYASGDNDAGATVRESRKKGIAAQHAYAILETHESHGQRLVKIRNPWGHREWAGAWSDGSKEWTSEWVQRLQHKFGDDGVFWMTYEDLLRKYKFLERTRVFGPEWHVAQQWTSLQVPWNANDYQQTRFTISIPEDSDTVIVLSQLDDRYFKGFQGKYDYKLHFRVQRDDEPDEDDYISRSPVRYDHWRSTNVEVFLEKGNYTVLIKVEAFENGADDIETVIRANYLDKTKITKIATLYDLAHAKGRLPKTEPPSALEAKTEAKAEASTEPEQEKKEEPKSKDNSKPKEELKKEDEPKPEEEPINAEPKKEDEGSTKEAVVPKNETDPPIDQKDVPPQERSKKEDVPSNPVSQAQAPPPKQELVIPSTKGEPLTPPIDPTDPCRTPFNAFCTVGLRVYSKISDLQLQVVLPSEERNATLDRDDIAKAALDEVKATTTSTAGTGSGSGGTNDKNGSRGKGAVPAKDDSDDSSDDDSD